VDLVEENCRKYVYFIQKSYFQYSLENSIVRKIWTNFDDDCIFYEDIDDLSLYIFDKTI